MNLNVNVAKKNASGARIDGTKMEEAGSLNLEQSESEQTFRNS